MNSFAYTTDFLRLGALQIAFKSASFYLKIKLKACDWRGT